MPYDDYGNIRPIFSLDRIESFYSTLYLQRKPVTSWRDIEARSVPGVTVGQDRYSVVLCVKCRKEGNIEVEQTGISLAKG